MAIESQRGASDDAIINQLPSQEHMHERAEDEDDADPQTAASDTCKQTRSKRRQTATFFHEHTFLNRDPGTTTCPNCLCAVTTIVERRNVSTTHLSALMLLPACLCVLPYWSKVLRDTIHRCPSCGIHLGVKFASARDAFLVCLGSQVGPSEPVNKDLVIAPNSDLQFF